MVSSITNFSRNGLSDWLLQRVSAVMMLAYSLFLVIYLLVHPHLTYADWSGLFSGLCMKIATILVLLSILAHAWIGLWIVFGDYVKCYCLRICLQFGVAILLISYVIWIITILWG